MQMRSDTWVVIPAFNEAPVIGGVVAGVRALFPRVLVVDDASDDDTAAIARAAGAYTATHPINLGQGAALQTGFEAALARGARGLSGGCGGAVWAAQVGAGYWPAVSSPVRCDIPR